MRKIIFFLGFICSITLNGQSVEGLIINLPGNEFTIDSVFSIIRKQQGIVFSYSSSLSFNNKVHFDRTVLNISEIVKTISTQAEVNFKIKGNKVLFYSKKKKHIVSGVIKDNSNGEVMPGAHVRVNGSNFGVVSNEQGFYFFKLEEGDYILSFSFLGYETVDKPISVLDETSLNIQLNVSVNNIDEVKVTKQRHFWGNMATGRNIDALNSKELNMLNTNNASDILQARIPGVWSTQSSGAPGDHQKVRIRGVNTLFGSTDPLYIIDGVAVPIVNQHSLGIADLNVNDIENITVLKDASSTSLYGFQGGNGVILIETKQSNENRLSFSSKFGVQRIPKKYPIMNAKDFRNNLDTLASRKITSIYPYYPKYTDTIINSDWQDFLFNDGIINEYQLSGSGSIGKNSAYFSSSYYNHDGILKNSNYKKYNYSGSIGRNFSQWFSAKINYRGSIQKNLNNLDNYKGNNLILEIINKSPMMRSTPDSFYYKEPRYKKETAWRQILPYQLLNSKELPDSVVQNTNSSLDVVSHSTSISLKYILSDNLFVNGASSFSYRSNLFKSDIKHYVLSNMNNYLNSNEHYLLMNQLININYNKTFNQHSFTIVTGYRNYIDNAYWNLDSIYNNSSSNNTYLKNSLAINGNQASITRYIQSLAIHTNYCYGKKYFISFIGNYEKLHDDLNQGGNGFFPSIALTWDISKESVFSKLEFINQFNLYTNWGKTGNYQINALSRDYYKNFSYFNANTIVSTKAISQLSNHQMKMEETNEYNLGCAIKLFNERVKITYDYYNKESSNLIVMRNTPMYYGGGRMYYNLGETRNYGSEIDLELEPISNINFSWISNFSISKNNQVITNTGVEKQINFYDSDILIPDFEVKENTEVGVIKGYKYLGEWTTVDDSLSRALGNDYNYFYSYGSKYLKISKTPNTLNDTDMINIGKTLPDFTCFWNNSFTFKNISIDFLWYGVFGIQKYNATKASTYIAAVNSEIKELEQEKRRTLYDFIFYQSSYFVEDASFIRLKQLTISYLFSKKIFNAGSIMLSLSFENILTLTKYSGYDPEASIYTDNSFSDFAVDRGAYPNPKAMYFTLKLIF
jgi:TonB-dependent starch-binding outer membrane protein SusC